MNPYLEIFPEAFGSAQLIPLSSHAMFFAMRGFGGYNLPAAALFGIAGGVCGQMINVAIGRWLLYLHRRGKLHMNEAVYAAAQKQFRYFLPFLLFCWFGLVGLLAVAAGFFRVRLWVVLAWIAAGYAGYFGYWVIR